jgi:hypothetical protein
MPAAVRILPAIAQGKYTIPAGSQERFLITLGLESKMRYLLGTIFLETHTDQGQVLKEGPLKIAVCSPP